MAPKLQSDCLRPTHTRSSFNAVSLCSQAGTCPTWAVTVCVACATRPRCATRLSVARAATVARTICTASTGGMRASRCCRTTTRTGTRRSWTARRTRGVPRRPWRATWSNGDGWVNTRAIDRTCGVRVVRDGPSYRWSDDGKVCQKDAPSSLRSYTTVMYVINIGKAGRIFPQVFYLFNFFSLLSFGRRHEWSRVMHVVRSRSFMTAVDGAVRWFEIGNLNIIWIQRTF